MKNGDVVSFVPNSSWTGIRIKIAYVPPDRYMGYVIDKSAWDQFRISNWFIGMHSAGNEAIFDASDFEIVKWPPLH